MESAANKQNIKVATTGNIPGILGKALASTTRSLSTPRTRNLESRTAISSLSPPILHVLVGWCPNVWPRIHASSSFPHDPPASGTPEHGGSTVRMGPYGAATES